MLPSRKKKRCRKVDDKEIRKLCGKSASELPAGLSGRVLEDGAIQIDLTEPIVRAGAEGAVFDLELTSEYDGLTRAADLDELENEVEISFSSELPVNVWGENEVLSHQAGDADFSRLAEVGAVLKNHNPNIIVGPPTKVWLDEKTHKGKLRFIFGTTASAQIAKREVLIDKSLRGVSVGYRVLQYIYLPNEDVSYMGRIFGPTYVATKWEALEASLTPIAADPSVGVGRSEKITAKNNKTEHKGRNVMNKKFKTWLEIRGWNPEDMNTEDMLRNHEIFVREEEEDVPAAPAAPATPATPAEERSRCTGIITECERHGITSRDRDEMIDSGISLEDARGRVLAKLAERTPSMGGPVVVIADDRSKFQRQAIESLQVRSGHISVRETKNGGHELASLGLKELARECLRKAGITPGSDIREVVDQALRGPKITQSQLDIIARGGEIISGSNSDFPYILAAGVNKSMLDGFDAAPTTYEEWCKIGSLSDFKEMNRVKLSESGDLQRVYENGKYQETAFSEDQNGIQVFTYGLKFNLSRQAIINDDLDAFIQNPRKMGAAAARLPNQLAVVALLANPTMNDSLALFGSGHSNYSASSDYAMDTLAHAQAGVQNIITKLRSQTGMLHAMAAAESKTLTLSLVPKILLIGQTNEFKADQVFGSGTDVSQENPGVKNPVRNKAMPVVEPLLEDSNITGNSTTAYYMFADPSTAPVIEVAFLNGNRTPFMEEVDQTDADGRVFKVRHDVGAAAIDHTGAVLETGETA